MNGYCLKHQGMSKLAVLIKSKDGGQKGVCHKCFQKEMGHLQNEKVGMPWRGWREGFNEWVRIQKQRKVFHGK